MDKPSNEQYLHKIGGKWHWFDESGDPSDPFETKEEALEQLEVYLRWLNDDEIE